MPQGDSGKSVIKQLEYCGFKYDLFDKPGRDKVQKIQSYANLYTDTIKDNTVVLLTVGRMILYSEPDNTTAIGELPAGEKLLVTNTTLRKHSSSIYYARVKSANGKYCGWVSLNSSNYELYTKSVKIIHDILKGESALYEKWDTPITCYDGKATGITYDF